jgi:sugar phosphate permease
MVSSAPPAHSSAFRTRRFLNWFPLGIAYAFLYMGRYNLSVAKSALGALMTKEDFGVIFGIGTLIYGVAFLVNGPLTDRIGGKRAMLIALAGAAVSNLLMGLYILRATSEAATTSGDVRLTFSFLYGTNMYFQSFGAVAIVKVNAYWFHVRERGGFSGIFGTMISSGIFLAFTVNGWVLSMVAGARPPQPADAVWVSSWGPSSSSSSSSSRIAPRSLATPTSTPATPRAARRATSLSARSSAAS